MNRSCHVAMLALLAAPAAAQIPARWGVAPRPVTVIGVDNGTAEQEFLRVSGAHRLPDGRVVVANGKPLELREYDANGRFLRRIGRVGDGPGEYRGRPDFLPAGADSIMIYDQVSTRTVVYDPAGQILRQWNASPGGAPRGQMIATNATIGENIPAGYTRCFRALATTLPRLPDAALREVFVDAAGRFWSHPFGKPAWMVYTAGGRAIGSVTLPAGFVVYEVGDNVVGKHLDKDDVEEVEVLHVGIPRSAPAHDACVGVADAFRDASGERAETMMRGLRAAMTAGEMAYSNFASYVTTVDSLPQLAGRLPQDTGFQVLAASRFGWAAVLFDRKSTLVCAFGEASEVPHGWTDGAVRCEQ